jgi:hypothetical protein
MRLSSWTSPRRDCREHSYLARSGEYPSTVVPSLLTTAPPFTSSPTPSHPTHRSSYNVYIDDINNTSRPRLAQVDIEFIEASLG